MAHVREDPRYPPGSGRWQVRYRDPAGKQRTKSGFRLKREAERWAKTVDVDVGRGTFHDVQRGKMPFDEHAGSWLARQSANLKPKTHHGYAQIINRRLIPTFGSTPLGKIDHQAVSTFINDLSSTYAASTVRKTYAVLKLVLDDAVAAGYVPASPAGQVSPPPLRGEREMLFLTAEQVEALANAVPKHFGMLVRFAAWTGLRSGELAALRVGDFEDGLAAVRVWRSLADVGGDLQFGETKSGKGRKIGVPATLRDDLRLHLDLVHPTGPTDDALVFPGEKGGPLRMANFYRRYYRPAVKAALPEDLHGLRFHDLRHTAAALMISLGAHPKEIAERLGHSSITVTMDRYGHVFPSRDQALTAALDDALRASRTSAL